MAKNNIADRLLKLFENVSLEHLEMPEGIGVLDPFHGNNSDQVAHIVKQFHNRFYSDNSPRRLMLGINPGRLGAGSTGLSFTDTKRCESDLGISVNGFRTHEPSSDFFYRMIRSAGGPEKFYSQVYVHSVCPLGFTERNKAGNYVNINYYDRSNLQEAVTPFITTWLHDLVAVGFRTDVAYCIGTGKNMKFLNALNAQEKFFEQIIPLEHPRYVMQYKSKSMGKYMDKYVGHVFGS